MIMNLTVTDILESARKASKSLLMADEAQINRVLLTIADALESASATILEANASDLSRMDPANPKYDRLRLTPGRISDIASDMRNVASLPSPLNRVLEERTLPNGLRLRKVSVPFGVIGVIYESRPNVSCDVASLCLKSGNVSVLKGGHEAAETNEALVGIIRRVLGECGIDADAVTLLPPDREATTQLLEARGLVDLIIPRGSASLIGFVRDNSRVPVIETGAGVCHAYFDREADTAMGAAIINNAKTRRVSVCNALDCLLVNRSRLSDLPALCGPLAGSNVMIHADADAFAALSGRYPQELLCESAPDDFGREFLDYAMAVKTVADVGEAIAHISRFGSGHSECIITSDAASSDLFSRMVDAACVYTNAPTSFTDGAQFGLGAEIGISTQKLHARGPMALREMTTYKWLISGNGQLRPS